MLSIQKTPSHKAKNINFRGTDNKDTVKTAIWYTNDLHGQLSRISRIKSAGDKFTGTFADQNDVDTLKVTSGDTLAGNDVRKNSFIVDFLNMLGIDASAIGNHELDLEEKGFAKVIKKAAFPFVASNLDIDESSPLKEAVDSGKLVKSTVVTKNGHKYGIVGTLPTDLAHIKGEFQPLPGLKYHKDDEPVSKKDNPVLKPETIKQIQDEVNKMLKETDKVILLSHLGYHKDLQLVKQVSGIDVVISGHSHDVLKGIKSGNLDDIDVAAKNKVTLVKSPAGEPVVITQAGKNGDLTGMLKATFDSKGVIIPESLENIIESTTKYNKSSDIETLKNQYFGEPEPLASLKEDCHPSDPFGTENPLSNLVADAVRAKAGTDVALFNSSTVRGVLDGGEGQNITSRDIQELFFFPNNFVKTQLTEKQLVEALNQGAQTLSGKPELLQVSGLKYAVSPDHTVTSAAIVKNDGSETALDIDNPSSNKTYTASYSDFLATGPLGMTALKKSEDEMQTFDWTECDATMEYVRNLKDKNLNLVPENRITFEE